MMRSLLCLIPIVLLVGCHNRESLLPGSWSDPAGKVLEVHADKTFSWPIAANLVANGTWSFDGSDVTFTSLTISGKPIAQLKSRMESMAARAGAAGKSVKKIADDLDKPDVFKLSADGKTMTTDKAKDTNVGPPITLTKRDAGK